jgi:hypothetical protein
LELIFIWGALLYRLHSFYLDYIFVFLDIKGVSFHFINGVNEVNEAPFVLFVTNEVNLTHFFVINETHFFIIKGTHFFVINEEVHFVSMNEFYLFFFTNEVGVSFFFINGVNF